MYAVLGVTVFKENDPFYFGSVPTAMLTLFKASTLESWNEHLWVNYYGCKEYNGNGLYFMKDEMTEEEWDTMPYYYKCSNPIKNPVLSYLYFLSFILLTSLIILSLFIGVITMSMQSALNHMRIEAEDANRRKKLKKNLKKIDKLSSTRKKMTRLKNLSRTTAILQNSIDRKKSRRQSVLGIEVPGIDHIRKSMTKRFTECMRSLISGENDLYLSGEEIKRAKELNQLKSLLTQAWLGVIDTDEDEDIDGFMHSLKPQIIKVANISRSAVDHRHFTTLVTCAIAACAVQVGYQTDVPTASSDPAFIAFDWIIYLIFLTEVVLRIAAEEFNLFEYFKSVWNVFDFIVIVGSQLKGAGAVLVVLRILRLLRILKVIKTFPQLAIIINSLIMATSSIGYVLLIILLTYYIFGVIGLSIFSDNDPVVFGRLHIAMAHLFRIATLDNWSQIMYKQLYGCANYPPPGVEPDNIAKRCVHSVPSGWSAIIYFILFVVLGALVMLTLFIGVITTAMDEATKQNMVEQDLEKKLHQTALDQEITSHRLEQYRKAFSLLDSDGGGTIDPYEFKSGLDNVNIGTTIEEVKGKLKAFDSNKDGCIDLCDFVVWMESQRKIALEKRAIYEKNVKASKWVLNNEERKAGKIILKRFRQALKIRDAKRIAERNREQLKEKRNVQKPSDILKASSYASRRIVPISASNGEEGSFDYLDDLEDFED